jgi:hypothetical protein
MVNEEVDVIDWVRSQMLGVRLVMRGTTLTGFGKAYYSFPTPFRPPSQPSGACAVGL